MVNSKFSAVLLAGLLTALAGCGKEPSSSSTSAGPDNAPTAAVPATVSYEDARRCFMAASTYTQLLMVTQQTEARKKMMDYAFNLRDETISLGKVSGKSESEIMPSEVEIKSHIEKSVSNAGSDDEPKLMPSPFLETEIAHCKLNDQLR